MYFVLLYFCIIAFIVSNNLASCKYPTSAQKTSIEPNRTMADFNRTLNVKTVLFSNADVCKVCWSPNELNLLIARRFMQDLIPKRIPRDFSALLNYINHCITTIKSKSSGHAAQTMTLALYDALGGYLHSVVLPILNEAFYAGNVDYSVTSKLHYLLGQMMTYLGTNGAAWANPCNMSKIPTKVAALPIKMCSEEESCKLFVLLEQKCKMEGNENNESVSCDNNGSGDLKIQIPFLDDNAYPSAIAVPLKDHALFSLMSECSVNILPKYYILAMRCLGSPKYSSKDIVVFNHKLHQWIVSTVVPHLGELDRWYPGFGSVMRVIETMNRRGLASTVPIKPECNPPTFNTTNCFIKETCSSLNSISAKIFSGEGLFSTLMWVLSIAGLFLLICVGFIFIKCILARIFNKNCNEDEVESLPRSCGHKNHIYKNKSQLFTGTSVFTGFTDKTTNTGCEICSKTIMSSEIITECSDEIIQ